MIYNMASLKRRFYDHRIRAAICASGNPNLFPELEIPSATAATWVRRGPRDVVELEATGDLSVALVERVRKLERRVAVLVAVAHLLQMMLRLSGFRFEWSRVPDADAKKAVLRTISAARPALPLRAVLRILKMSSSRYHVWKRADTDCELQDAVSCPRSQPSRITAAEKRMIKEMALDEANRHLPISRLALLAQRFGKVYASSSTWGRLIRLYKWRRPRARVYPAKPKVGIQATGPNEYWHIDVTAVKLLDGTRAYVHGVIDNYSRKILAWRVVARLEPGTTRAVLEEAALSLGVTAPKVVMDSGGENLNATVDDLLQTTVLTRVLALVEVTFSNSKIEAFWRSMRHGWLYLNHLDDIGTLERLVRFYVDAHNTTPHSSFRGRTPAELYNGSGGHVVAQLVEARRGARGARLVTNRSRACGACPSRDAPHSTQAGKGANEQAA